MRNPTFCITGRKNLSAICVSVILGLCIGVGYHWYASSRPDITRVGKVDTLNTQARLVRYVYPDSALLFARKAARMARNYADGRSEALNHQMFICFLRMDFDECMDLYNRIQQSTSNQIELLVSEVNMMMICQRAAQNRLFFDYYNRALERIQRIREEYDEVKGRNKERLDYAMTEFSLTTATNYINLMQEQEAEKELSVIDTDGYIRQNKALLIYYYYLNGLICQNRLDLGKERVVDAFDYFYLAYSFAERLGNIYFSSMLEQVFSEMFAQPKNYDIIKTYRKVELDYLYNSLVTEKLNEAGFPVSLRLSTALAQKALSNAEQCGNLLLKINGFRVLGNTMFAKGEYYRALNCFETALSYLNLHHQIYYPEDKERLLTSFESRKDSAVDMLWSKDSEFPTVPGYLTYIRERLSATYSALNDKQKSDYNRNLYLDLMDFTRQDKSLESRVDMVAQDNKILNTLLGTIILLTLVFGFFLFLYARKWKLRDAKQYSLLKDMSEWFMEVAFTKSEEGLEEVLNAYPWIKKEKRILHEILRPYIKWTEKNRILSDRMDEERMQLREEYLQSERQIARDKKTNISKRAKVSLVHSIMPFIDRILYMVRRMENKNEYDRGTLTYIGELADEINCYNDVLAEWIRMNRGELELTIESFPLQDLFKLLDKGQYNFKCKGIDFLVEPTDAWVKADRALTFFMLNTLTDNARKFTPSEGQVTVCATELADAVEIKVSDTGCGLTESEIALILSSKIYDAQQIGVNSSTVRHEKGSGFGLLNCKGIIEKYKKSGEFFKVCCFHIESEENKGSCFSFRLPKGIRRKGMMVLTFIFYLLTCGQYTYAIRPNIGNAPTHEETDMNYGELKWAVFYADSVYFANVHGDYERSMQYADSTFKYINRYYEDFLPEECVSRQLTATGSGMEELEWLSLGVKADYFLIMGFRNEMAIAALALHDWEKYEFNNRQFTHLYKLLTKDDSLEEFYIRQRNTQINLSVSLALLVFMLFIFSVLIYIVYFRRRILFRFNVMQVLETNHAMLNVIEMYARPERTDELMFQLLSVVLSRLKELHEINSVRLLLYRGKGEKIGTFLQGKEDYGVLADSLLSQAYETENAVFDEMSNTQIYPLLLRLNGNERLCIGSVAVNYGTYRMQKEDFIFENYIVNYLAILLYEAVIQRGQDLENVESAENEKQRSLYERTRIKVQNQILDNCLSTIKHESMYYPSRMKQIIRKLEEQEEHHDLKTSIHSLRELAEYYKEIYTLLCAQADRQIDTGYFKCEKLSPHVIGKEWMKTIEVWRKKKAYDLRLSFVDELQQNSFMNVDATLVRFMLETLTKEWATRLAEREKGGCLTLCTSEDDGFVRFTLQSSVRIYDPEEAVRLFQPDVKHYPYLLCKEIVREHDKLNNFCGCRINIETDVHSSGCSIWFIVPKYR